MWLVLIAHKGGYMVHSVHKDEGKAKVWRDCKQFDGEDAIIVELHESALDEIITTREDT